ncbi:hypothetical protein EKD04_006485 [Chloroflexales bacterium ZM16-3]|nr:hypothetical protein [Chloroflexales bacterium ZM16-3]
MRFLFDPMKEHEQKLEKFRQSFRLLTSDGTYPPDRQQRLFQASKKTGLDWEEARAYILDDAVRFLNTMVEQIIADATITADEIADLRRMQRRLAVPDERAGALLDRVFDLVERRLANRILEYAAYLGEAAVIQSLKDEVARYDLPLLRSARLMQQLDRQHQLATMMIGNLPVVQTNVPLYRDEACHYDASVTVLASEAGGLVEGRLLITSQRLMVLASSGGLTSEWAQCRAVESMDQSLVLVTSTHNAMIMCDDPQYVATLIAAARRRYVPQAVSQPIRAGKRLG